MQAGDKSGDELELETVGGQVRNNRGNISNAQGEKNRMQC